MGFFGRLFEKRPAAEQPASVDVITQFQADLQQAQAGEQRYLQGGDRSGLDEAVAAWERILQHATFPNTPDRFQLAAYNNGGTVLGLRYWAQGQLADLNRALQLLQTAVQRTPSDSPDLPMYLNNLGNGLRDRYASTGLLTDLEEAIGVYQTAVQRTPPNSPELPMYLNNLGNGLRDRYARTGLLADLEKAIGFSEVAVQRTLPDSPNLPMYLNNLGNGLSDRYARSGQLADLEEAIGFYEAAVQRTPLDSPNLPMYLNNLGTGLRDRYARTGELPDLEAAIGVYQTAVQRTSPDSPALPSLLNNLGTGLRARYARTGQLADLEAAIGVYQTAVQHTPPDSPALPSLLNNLGAGLRARYARTSQLADLEAAIGFYEAAVQRTPPDSPDLPRNLNNLGNGLRTRYARTGLLADLEKAIGFYEVAVRHAPPDSPDLPGLLNNLGAGFSDRYDRTRQLADLEAVINFYEATVQRTPPDSPDLPMYLSNLGTGLCDRYDRTRQLADLEAAIGLYEAAVQRTPLDSPDHASLLNNLSSSLSARYDRTGLLADLEKAIGCSEAAVQRTPPDSPNLPMYLNNLGNGLSYRYTRTDANEEQKERDETEGVTVYEQACQLGKERQISLALSASRNWGQWALTRHAWDEANRAYKFGLTALEQLYQTQLLQHEQQSWQREAQGLYAQAAYALARGHDLPGAVVLFEQGQARGLNDRLARDEANLLQVQQHSPDLYQQYQESAGRLRQLEASERQVRLLTTNATAPPDWADHRQQVQQARDDLQTTIDSIRQLDGYEQFLQPPRFEEVATAVQTGHPFAYLVTTTVGSLALLLYRPTPNTEVAIEPLWADAFTQADLNTFLFKRKNGQLQGGYLPGQFSGGAVLRAALAEGLPLLGEKLLTPLTQRLQALGLNRITLVPGGRLNLLPLHATYVTINDQPTPFVEAFTVSYAPSARTLAASRRRLKNHVKRPATLLAVGNPLPLPDGINSLHFARPEAEEIALRFGGTNHLYCETAATHAAVTAAIPGTRYLHFSCHGLFDLKHPLSSGLILSDGVRLTLRQVLDEIPLNGTRLVTLSACQTAVSDFNNLPDEVIGLPAGFLEAGAAGVLGSLWPVDDLSTALFMDHFYQLHWGNGNESMAPAEALQATQCWLRHLTVGELSQLFAKYKADAPDAPAGRMAYALAQEKFTDFTLAENQQTTPYADPYYWAAFAFYGM